MKPFGAVIVLLASIAVAPSVALVDPPTDSPGDHIFDFTKPGSKVPEKTPDAPTTATTPAPTTPAPTTPAATDPVPGPTTAPVLTPKPTPSTDTPAPHVPAPVPAAPTKLSPPAAAALAESIKQVNEAYADDITKATTTEQKVALSGKMRQAGIEETMDMSGKYAVLQRSAEIAEDASDVDAAFAAIDEMAKTFQINAVKQKSDIIVAMAKSPRTDHLKFATATKAMADDAEATGNFEWAKYYIDLAEASAKQTHDAQLTADISARSKQIVDAQGEYNKVKQAEATLKLKPADPDANLKLGEFDCYFLGDWEKGLPLLAHGGDATVAAAAALELKSGSDSADALPIADHWWAIAEKETGNSKLQIRGHAAAWYQKVPSTVTGLAKTRAEKRAAEGETAVKQLAATTVSSDPVQLINTVGNPEAHEILHSVLMKFPDAFHDAKKAELIIVHNGLAFPHGQHAQKVPGSRSAMATVGNGQPWLWGIYQDYEPGDYVFVYRLRAGSKEGGEALFLDVCSNGNTINGIHPSDAEVATGDWVNLPVPVSLSDSKNVEIRLWTHKTIACDRVYVFKKS